MLRSLQNEGIHTRLLSLTTGEAFEKEIIDLGMNIDWVGSSKNNFARLTNIIGNLRRNPVDVIQSAHFFTNIYAALAGRALGITSIGAIRSDFVNEMLANGVFSRWHLNLPKQLIANSRLAVDRAIASGIDRSRIHLVKNAVADGNCPRPVRECGKLNLLFAGRLDSPKRPELFIELASELCVRHPEMELKFLIAGDGPLRASLEHKAKERGFVGDEMSFLGEQTIMSDVYQQSDILILTSRHEGTPNVVLEAMAHSLAVIATSVGGVPEIVNEDCGIVVDPYDFSVLVEATSTLIADPEKRVKMGENGSAFIRKNHSISCLQRELSQVYSRIF